ncbi:MAG TPA: DUF1501 domain-containing protein [Planctomycetaceae bacterium]|nr:DUF1501 domain-containing protein [Planctomycetaceae bacterium]
MNERVHARHLSRRDVIQIGTLAAIGGGLHPVGVGGFDLTSRATGDDSVKAPNGKSCILIWLDGGPSHLEMFDPKPDAPAEVRGPLGTVATSLPAVRFSECLEKTATMVDDIAVVRSITSPLGEHNFGTHYMMTGYKPTPVLEYPCFGSVLAHHELQRAAGHILPPHIAVPNFRVGGASFAGSGYLPNSVKPFSVESDPAKPGFKVKHLQIPNGLTGVNLARRKKYLEKLNQFYDAAAATDSDGFQEAFKLIGSRESQIAFQLDQEPDNLRQRYGRRTIGQSCLLARRLVQRGVPFVTVNYKGWDTHNDLMTRLKDGYAGAKTPVGLIPSLDLALSALIQDLKQQGMLDDTLVVVMGEFGRTPKLNTNGGRDHWPRVFSALLAGGGVQGGQIIGASDRTGESPKDNPITPADLAASIYHVLGINPAAQLSTRDGRPVRLTPAGSRVISELT